ncbi:MAG: hypothetical protein BWY29_00529 [Microgenomates group bacterium ADurb.Bin238]|jgi:hypothetical protein|nr:MAG: hypothetical protein BWY29_00529 [Microgenomates group bacterium ADurb.Bin238]
MKRKIPIIILAIVISVAAWFVFDIYFYGAAKNSHCVAQTRQEFPEERGTPSQEWFDFYDECLDNLTVMQTFALMFSRPQKLQAK